jgi:hypothetical protein
MSPVNGVSPAVQLAVERVSVVLAVHWMRPGRGGEGSWVGSRERGRGRVETGRLLNTSEQREGVTGAVAFYSERRTEAEGRETARRSWSVLGCWEGVECIRRRPTWCSSRRRAQGWEPFARRMRRTRQALLLQCLPIVSPRAVKVGAMVNRRTWTRTLRSGRRERARRAVATRVEGRWTVVGEGATRMFTQRQRLRVCLHSARLVRVVMRDCGLWGPGVGVARSCRCARACPGVPPAHASLAGVCLALASSRPMRQPANLFLTPTPR